MARRTRALDRDGQPDARRRVDRAAAGAEATAGEVRYDAATITFHWTTAALVAVQFVLSQAWPFVEGHPRHLMLLAHLAFGLLLSAVLVARIAWRFIGARRLPPASTGLTQIASRAVHYALYVLLAGSAVLGVMTRLTARDPLTVLGVVVPAPFGPYSEQAHETISSVHGWIGWAIVVLAAGHAAAALVHHFLLRDAVLQRMRWSRGMRGAG
jgi:cytochrome b561